MKSCWQRLSQFNTFNSGTNDLIGSRAERCISWIYLFLFISAIGILAFYTSLEIQTTTIRVKKPSLSTYDYLQSMYPDILDCPCSTTEIQYSTFIEVYPRFHQICSSVFITQSWIATTLQHVDLNYWPMDMRALITAYAQGLRFLCEAGWAAVTSSMFTNVNGFIYTPSVIPNSRLEMQIRQMVQGVTIDTPQSAGDVIALFSYSIGSQLFINARGTNAMFYGSPRSNNQILISTNVYQMEDGSLCSCLPAIKCTIPAAIYWNNTTRIRDVLSVNMNKTLIPGMKTDCYPFEGLMASSLECFFNQSCLQLLFGNSTSLVTLNASSESRYSPTDTVEKMMSALLMEKISFSFSRDAYYQQCAPEICTYSYVHRNTPLTIITTIIGIVSGLDTILRFLLPKIAILLSRLKRKYQSFTRKEIQVVQHSSIPVMTTKEKIIRIWVAIKNVNLFDSNTTDAVKFRQEIQMTRVFVCLFILVSTILTFYVGFTKNMMIHTLKNPSRKDFELLEAKFSDKLVCPCKSTEALYHEVAQMTVKFHQICSSGFVSPIFIAQLYGFDGIQTYKYDFMNMAGTYFTHLGLFCALVKKQIEALYRGILGDTIFAQKLISPSEFDIKLSAIVHSSERGIGVLIQRTASEILELLTNTHGLSTSFTSFTLETSLDGQIRIEPNKISNCSCITQNKICSIEAAFYRYDIVNRSVEQLYQLSGIRIGCSPFQSTLQSTLACWYSKECHEKVHELLQNRINQFFYMPPLLNRSLDIAFHQNDSITDLLLGGMIDSKFTNWSYDLFFEKCGVTYCSYPIIDRQNIIIIVTSLIGIASGLSVALQLFTPLLFHLVRHCLEHLQGRHRLLAKIQQLPHKVIHLNVFFNRSKSTEATIRKERLTTRIYLLIWIIIFIILVAYNILAEQTITITVSEPNEDTYTQLDKSRRTSLKCSCSTIGFKYNSFLKLDARLHQICYSSFVEDSWVDNIYGNGNWTGLVANEFRRHGVAYFLILKSVCSTAQRMIDVIVIDLEQSRIMQRLVYSRDQLLSKIDINTENLKKRSLTEFRIFRQAVLAATQFNQLMNIFSSNWILTSIPTTNMNLSNYRLSTRPVSHGLNCSCATSSFCTEPVVADDILVPGFALGCSPTESLFRSTLICLYNMTCVKQINFGNLSWIHPLNPTLTSRFNTNDLVSEIVAEALIEEWSLNVSYSSYFSECQPSSCTYSLSIRKTILEMVTMFLGLYGGLTIILRVAARSIISGSELILIHVYHRHSRVTPLM